MSDLLTRISHRQSTSATDMLMRTALWSEIRLDILPGTPETVSLLAFPKAGFRNVQLAVTGI